MLDNRRSTESHEKRSIHIVVISVIRYGCLVSKAATHCWSSRRRYLYFRLRITPASIRCTAAVLFPPFHVGSLNTWPTRNSVQYGQKNGESTCLTHCRWNRNPHSKHLWMSWLSSSGLTQDGQNGGTLVLARWTAAFTPFCLRRLAEARPRMQGRLSFSRNRVAIRISLTNWSFTF